MRIVLADDQIEVREALRLLIEQEPGLVVVGEAGECGSLLSQMEISLPELVLLDWELPGPGDKGSRPNGPDHLVSDIQSVYPNVLVIALSGRPEARESALAAGANAFISKGDSPDRLLATLREIKAKVEGPVNTSVPLKRTAVRSKRQRRISDHHETC